jgi:hypothetical protein
MKRLLLLIPLFLFGCTDPRIDEIREKAVAICGFAPTLSSVSQILANPGLTSAAAIAQAICDAVTAKPPVGLYGNMYPQETDCPKVNGVCVEGDFVEKPKEEKPKEEKGK